ncbi:hypothetical protein [Bradyrhizobium sp. McL0616]|uniref:hypothetical protein n=1 Tax=Bradyrhizobium sp. McL0616 TaxID=3415674 RepID=UPI003CFA67DD
MPELLLPRCRLQLAGNLRPQERISIKVRRREIRLLQADALQPTEFPEFSTHSSARSGAPNPRGNLAIQIAISNNLDFREQKMPAIRR